MNSANSRLASLKRWIGWLLVATAFTVACVYLSDWQFDRREEALARIALIKSNYDKAPVDLEELLPYNSLDESLEWRPATIRGHYLPETAVLVRNRPLNGQPGFLQLVGFELESGKVIAIERGWMPTGNLQDSPDLVPVVSDNLITLVGRLRPSEPNIGRDAPVGQIATLNMNEWIADRKITQPAFKGFYLRMQSENPTAGASAKTMPMPDMGEGNHLSYALQWILFALMAISALVWAIRTEAAAKRVASGAQPAKPKRRAIGDSDKAFEDSV